VAGVLFGAIQVSVLFVTAAALSATARAWAVMLTMWLAGAAVGLRLPAWARRPAVGAALRLIASAAAARLLASAPALVEHGVSWWAVAGVTVAGSVAAGQFFGERAARLAPDALLAWEGLGFAVGLAGATLVLMNGASGALVVAMPVLALVLIAI
jgi:hypothetical protein